MNELIFEQVLLLVASLLVSGFVFLKWVFRSRWRERSKNKNDLHVVQVASRKKFHNLLFSMNELGVPASADVVTVDLEAGRGGKRVVGALMFITKSTLQRNKDLIKRKVVSRDSKMRQRTFIPGRKKTWNDKVVGA